MAEYTTIFVDSQMPLEDFVRELQSLLTIRFHLASDSRDEWYEYSDPQIALWVRICDYYSSPGLNFDDYRYEIEVRSYNAQTWEESKKRRGDFARHVFEKLKGTKRYPLMLVDNLQSLRGEYTPEDFPQPSVLTLKARTLPSDMSLYVNSASSPEMLSQNLKHYFQAQGLKVSSTEEVDFLLPTMSVMVIGDTVAKSSEEVSSAPTSFSYDIRVKARMQLPGGLAVPGERRYWVYELMMRLFEHLKVLGRYRLVLRDEDENRDLATFDPRAAQ